MRWEIRPGDWIERLREMPAESVHCCVTSPPYWGLRDYGVSGQLGLEKTPELYVSKMVEGFREVRRVLRKDGTLWLNLGDCYTASNRGSGGHNPKQDSNRGSWTPGNHRGFISEGCKPKDLVGIPWMQGFALRADGWWLRSDIIWYKRDAMPESVTDRPTKAHEYLFLLTKSASYFYDAEAIKEPIADYVAERIAKEAAAGMDGTVRNKAVGLRGDGGCLDKQAGAREHLLESGRNKRSVWEITTSRFAEAHFATFPPKLVEPCILAGTSERGCCPKCGAPWERITEAERSFESGSGKAGNLPAGKNGHNLQGGGETLDIRRGPVVHSTTLGWRPTCSCNVSELVPCTVLDPFAGAGTTGLVALRLQRNFVGIELKQEYVEMARRRIEQDAPLLNRTEVTA